MNGMRCILRESKFLAVIILSPFPGSDAGIQKACAGMMTVAWKYLSFPTTTNALSMKTLNNATLTVFLFSAAP